MKSRSQKNLLKFFSLFYVLVALGFAQQSFGSQERIDALKSLKTDPPLPDAICRLIDEYTPDADISNMIRIYKRKRLGYGCGTFWCLPVTLTFPVTAILSCLFCDQPVCCAVSCQSIIMQYKNDFLGDVVTLLKLVEREDTDSELLKSILKDRSQTLEEFSHSITDQFEELIEDPNHDDFFSEILGIEWPSPCLIDD